MRWKDLAGVTNCPADAGGSSNRNVEAVPAAVVEGHMEHGREGDDGAPTAGRVRPPGCGAWTGPYAPPSAVTGPGASPGHRRTILDNVQQTDTSGQKS